MNDADEFDALLRVIREAKCSHKNLLDSVFHFWYSDVTVEDKGNHMHPTF